MRRKEGRGRRRRSIVPRKKGKEKEGPSRKVKVKRGGNCGWKFGGGRLLEVTFHGEGRILFEFDNFIPGGRGGGL